MKAVKALREIVGREGLGPLNYRALAEKINVQLNLLEFFQASADAAKEFRNMSQRLNMRKRPRPGNKEFYFVAVLRGRYNEKSRWKKVTLSPGISQADQGSELSIISQGLVNAMAFPRFTLSREKDDSGLFVSTADGGATELKEFTYFNVGVSGIWRRVYAFIRPYDKKGSGELHLVLGLPWLYEVNAVISVRTSSIVIEDKKLDGCITTLNSPELIPSSPHNLVLQPKIPVAFRSSEGKSSFVAETEDYQVDDESSDTTVSEDMMSDTENSEAESLK
ncbi:hypothetical protein EV44_g3672 [Erysiphe necator]|uniref:Uncharacterized protein n=1 Tax=Uncinula necator TaxID=52586 RepID=A0A0B1P4M4_UNCNE|nr:hypothetical protein EV44_g3672 [Erysiphe necator]